METKKCNNCQKTYKGRSNKIFCSSSCKNNFHNKAYKNSNKIVIDIDKKLHKNRTVLKDLFLIYRSSLIDLAVLEASGFDKQYLTHIFNAPSGDKYTMLYEIGYKLSFDNKVQIVEIE